MNEMAKALEIMKIAYKKQSVYGLHCQCQKATFTMEVNTLEDLTNILIVKFKRLSGEMRAFREISSGLLSCMDLV